MKKFLVIVLIIFLSSALSYAQDLRITEHKGVEFKFKPSLTQRISGIKEIYLFYPNSATQDNRYVYHNFKVYLQRLGLKVKDRGIKYKQVDASQGPITAYILSCTEDITQYMEGVNTLAVVINIGYTYGQYSGKNTIASFNFIDPYNEYTWTEQFEPAGSAERYIKQCQSKICSYYSYNSSYAFQPPYMNSNYSQHLLRSYIDKGEYSSIEGIYEGDEYTIGVKKATNGKYYLIYHNSKTDAGGWKDGYIKAVLRETSTPGIYRATWYGRYFTQLDYKIIFEQGMLTTFNEQNEKELYLKMYPTGKIESDEPADSNEWSGTGFALKENYIVTNYHVIEDANSIQIQGINGNFNTRYNANVIATDKYNDLAILKVEGVHISPDIPYSVKTSTSDVGEDVFVLGYPMTSTMGEEIKLTTGVVSSKTGFQGDVSLYQISAPIQPGNSGGPLFDGNGNVIGIVSAKHQGAENVGYSIKTSYLRNLMESAMSNNILPQTNKVMNKKLSEKVKSLKDFVYYITCSNKNTPVNISTQKNTPATSPINNHKYPSINTDGETLAVTDVKVNANETILSLSSTNNLSGGWVNINKDAYISANGIKYKLIRTEGITYAPEHTYFRGETKNFKLYFQPIPQETRTIDFIESPSSAWKIYGIQLK